MSDQSQIDGLMCQVLRREEAIWPPGAAPEFERRFLARASDQGVDSLVHEIAHHSGYWTGWPLSVRDGLTSDRRAQVAIELSRAHHLSAFFAELSRRDIAFLVTKGAALAHTLYADPGLRPRVDTDLFIGLESIVPIQNALRECGYEVVPPIYKSHQFMGIKRTTEPSMVLDIHWRILNAPRFARIMDFGEAWARSVPVRGMDGWRTLDRVDALVLACMHRAGSEWHDKDRLIWLYDIHALCTSLDANQVSEFTEKAMRKHIVSACVDGVIAASRWFGPAVPEWALESLRTPATQVTWLQRLANSNLGLLAWDWFELHGIRARWSLLVELFFPPRTQLGHEHDRSNPLRLGLHYVQRAFGKVVERLSLK